MRDKPAVDLDQAIDQAVHAMLDVAPPAELRARVQARLDVEPRRSWIWVPATAAAAAALALALALPALRPSAPPPAPRLASRTVLPMVPAPADAPRRLVAAPAARDMQPGTVDEPERVAVAAVAAPFEPEGGPTPLPAVTPIELHAIGAPAATIGELRLPGMSIAELSIGSITDQPRERH
jgi:hypothetical protein